MARLMEQSRQEDMLEQAKKEEQLSREPLHNIIPHHVALRCRDVAFNMAAELPKDESEERLSRLRAAKSSTGAVLRDGASVDQAATHASLRALEQWVRILRPFASGHLELAKLISRLVHMEQATDSDNSMGSEEVTQIIPPVDDPFGHAIRRVVPMPLVASSKPWDFLEDVLKAFVFEDRFDAKSIIHRRLNTANGARGAVRQAGGLVLARPRSTGQLSTRPPDAAARIRLSGDFPWADFQSTIGFRACTATICSDKYLRRVPGPGTYGDYPKHLAVPQLAARAQFPSTGDKRPPGLALPLMSQLDRFFAQDFRID